MDDMQRGDDVRTNAVVAMDLIGYRRVLVLYDVFRKDIASLLASPRIIKSGAVRMDVQSSMTELQLTPQGNVVVRNENRFFWLSPCIILYSTLCTRYRVVDYRYLYAHCTYLLRSEVDKARFPDFGSLPLPIHLVE
jgi:hypothetical protein